MSTIDRISVRGFKSIAKSENIHIENTITTLVGPNEAGKTSFLEALEFSSHRDELKSVNVCDYEECPDLDNNPVIEVEISGVDINNIDSSLELGDLSNKNKEITISLKKNKNGGYSVESSDIERELERYKSTRPDRYNSVMTQVNSTIENIKNNISNTNEDIENFEELNEKMDEIARRTELGGAKGIQTARYYIY